MRAAFCQRALSLSPRACWSAQLAPNALTEFIDAMKSAAPQLLIAGRWLSTVQRLPVTNPFTGEETMFKAKPARNVVKIRPVKAVKDMV